MSTKDAYEHLKNMNLIDYGVTIRRRDIEDALDMPYEADMKFIGPFLSLKEHIESEGFFCTSERLQPGELRILDANEMTLRADKIQSLLMRKQKRTLLSMLHTDISRLSEEERLRHQHANTKLSLGMAALKSILNDI